jgi:PHD/YefM family antitoxin component YafN of YafNO toxin-antitoxin module
MQQLEDSKLSLEAAMRALFERMDRFIRGLESNGKK